MRQHNKIVINGQFANRRMTGQERFAYEVLGELDKLVTESENIELIVPENSTNIPHLSNIPVKKYGMAKGSLWEQTYFAFYAIIHNATTLNLCSIMPLLKPGIICIHDIDYKVNPQNFTTLYARISKIWHLLQFNWAWKFSRIILTVSEFSKKQIHDVYGVDLSRIHVVTNGWEHFERVVEDTSVKERYPAWFSKPYFFSLGSLAPQKNIEWILKVARQHPQYTFLIAGYGSLKEYGKNYQSKDYSNVIFLGYIQDGEIKHLMRECKAFIFPSYYEGFGIPPLEALSVGAQIIVSKTSCLPEIFEDSACYIDPYNTNVNLDELLSTPIKNAENILKKRRFSETAEYIYQLIFKSES